MTGLLEVSNGGERVRRAIAAAEESSPALTAAVRRAIPFIAKRSGEVFFEGAHAVSMHEAVRGMESPGYVLPFRAKPTDSLGFIGFDGPAIALLLDGMLGGGGEGIPTLTAGRLSPAQQAFMARVGGGVLAAYADVLRPVGVDISKFDGELGTDNVSAIVSATEVHASGYMGKIIFVLGTSAALAAAKSEHEEEVKPGDAAIPGILGNVEVELAAELGRTRMSLRDVAKLTVGSTILVETALGGRVTVRAAGKALFTGEPSQEEGRVVIRIKE